MILSALLLGATIVVGTSLIAEFWSDFTNWLKKAINKVKEIAGKISFGVKVFIRKIQEGLKEISKHYSKNGTEWEETVVTRKIPENEVPPEIRAKASYSYDRDVTDELEMILEG